jgi:hypothetical protein
VDPVDAGGVNGLPPKELTMKRINLIAARLAPVVAMIVASGAGTKWH